MTNYEIKYIMVTPGYSWFDKCTCGENVISLAQQGIYESTHNSLMSQPCLWTNLDL